MPALSVKQRRLMAIAEHDPDAVYGRNRGVLDMSRQQLHDFAATPERNLPEQSPKPYGGDHMANKFIAGAIKHPGALHRDLHVPQGDKIPLSKAEEAEHSKNPKVRKRANFYLNVLRKAH